MKRRELLEQLDISREKLLVALELLPDRAFAVTGVMDSWSITDILAHLITWESELVTALRRIKQGKKPSRLKAAYEDVDSYNEQRYLENRNRDLDRIFEDLIGVRLQLEDWLMEFSDRELERPLRYKWAGNQTLWEIVRDNSFEHEIEHLAHIEEFARGWLSQNEEGSK